MEQALGRLGWTYEVLLDTPLPVIEAALRGRSAFAVELIETLLSPFVKKKGGLIRDDRKKLTADQRRREVAKRLRGALGGRAKPD